MSDADTPAAEEDDRRQTEEQEQQEAESGFSSGFSRVAGTKPKETPKAAEAETDDDTPAEPPETGGEAEEGEKDDTKPESGKEEEPDPWEGVPQIVRDRIEQLESLPNRLRNIEGHIGGMKQNLDKMNATAKAAAKDQGARSPTDEQVAAAAQDAEEWKHLKDEFPEWADGFEKQMGVMEQRILSKVPSVDTDSISQFAANIALQRTTEELNQLQEALPLYVKYPTWKAEVKKPEFIEFAYDGGPSQDERAQLDSLERTDPQQAEQFQSELIRKYPQWWSEKGSLIYSDSVTDSIALMDKFNETAQAASKQPPADTSRREKQNQRLDAATTPKGAGGAPEKGVDDDEAFSRGFKSAIGR